MITINIETKPQDKIKDIEVQLIDLRDKIRQLNLLVMQILADRREASLSFCKKPLSEDYDEIDSKSS
jgi:hypothetical protein